MNWRFWTRRKAMAVLEAMRGEQAQYVLMTSVDYRGRTVYGVGYLTEYPSPHYELTGNTYRTKVFARRAVNQRLKEYRRAAFEMHWRQA